MSTEKKLNALRAEIDAIDDSIHDLIMRRTKVVKKVRNVKSGERIKIRPGREAEILYRLLDRHNGDFPKRELCRMWRELIVATLSMEGPFSMAVFAPEANPGLWDMARDQYGSFTPIIECATEHQVIRAVDSQKAVLGILPLPKRDDPDAWWRHLMDGAGDASNVPPKIIARLPSFGASNAREKGTEALVICPVIQRPTGHDHTYFALEAQDEMSSGRLNEALSKQGASLVSSFSRRNANSWLYLVETSEFMADLTVAAPIIRAVNLGGYALPISDRELDS